MKKGLSVLLIAAALFGFYGGAVNLNDVLACKDYWEEEREKSTADMNKLEDGLNQLKDNEQAYLDGLDAVAEGEEALAQGEQDYADGQATLAKGEADYAAAPAKLRAGEKKLAAGKSAIAKGEKDLASLNNLIDGIEQVLDGYPTFKNGYKQLRDGRVGSLTNPADTSELLGLFDTLSGNPDPKVSALAKTGKDSLISAATKMASQDPKSFTNDQYDSFNDALTDMLKAMDIGTGILNELLSDINTNVSGLSNVVAQGGGDPTKVRPYIAGALTEETVGKLKLLAGGFDKANAAALVANIQKLQVTDPEVVSDEEYKAAFASVSGELNNIADIISGKKDKIAENRALPSAWVSGYEQITSNDTISKQKKLVGGVDMIIGGVLDSKNDELIKGMNSAAKAAGFTPQNFTPAATSKLAKDMASSSKLEDFYQDMNKIESGFKKVLPALKNKSSDGAKTLKAGKRQVAAGQKELNKGYADYKAAPAKLAAGRAQLAEGLQKLMDGRKELAAGKDKLAEYEDGEQQVRDGLATLMGTEPNGGLESILDRRSGDDDFDNGDKHLDLDEGLDAVDVGRGYQADSGELITKEITNRAIGTAAGLGAAALAVLAAILSFLKKNKGAGVLAILSAAAGGAGIAAGTSAGMEFSSIAGSAVGATPWIAFGILAGVAAVHAIAHFASKEA